MHQELLVRLQSSLPKLAWCAELNLTQGRCVVDHGSYVLVDPAPAPQWVAACIWDGPAEEGRFHVSPHVFGTGVRLEGDAVHFVPSCTMIERLFCVRTGEQSDVLVVSNSLVVILARMGASLGAVSHRAWAGGICLGIYDYNRDVPVRHERHESIRQVIYTSLIIRDGVETFASRDAVEQFSSFADYHDRLQKVLRALVANGKSSLRKRPVQLVTNASRGYDSPAVTALVTELGHPVTSYSSPRSNTRIPSFMLRFMDADVIDDDGRDIAKQLGAAPEVLDSDLTKIPGVLEKWIWASGQISPELIFWRLLSDAAERDALTIWFAGHFGDGMWDTQPDPRALQGTLYRGAPSGYALAEARIYCGIVDCSLPYVFGVSLANVRKVSMSEEMAPWRLGNDYDRPIPRRLLEERGINRKAFGFGKKAVAQDFDSPQGHELREAFFRETPWSAAAEHGVRLVNNGIYFVSRAGAFIRARGKRMHMMHGAGLTKGPIPDLVPALDLRRHTFTYCVASLVKESLATVSQQSSVKRGDSLS